MYIIINLKLKYVPSRKNKNKQCDSNYMKDKNRQDIKYDRRTVGRIVIASKSVTHCALL